MGSLNGIDWKQVLSSVKKRDDIVLLGVAGRRIRVRGVAMIDRDGDHGLIFERPSTEDGRSFCLAEEVKRTGDTDSALTSHRKL